MAIEQLPVLSVAGNCAGTSECGDGKDLVWKSGGVGMLTPSLSAARFPPLQKTQKRGTYRVGCTKRSQKPGLPADLPDCLTRASNSSFLRLLQKPM